MELLICQVFSAGKGICSMCPSWDNRNIGTRSFVFKSCIKKMPAENEEQICLSSEVQAPRTRNRKLGSHWETPSLEQTLDILERKVDHSSLEDFILILQRCRKEKNLTYTKRVYAYICYDKVDAHITFGNFFVPMFVECGSISYALQVFSRLIHPNVHSWTSLMLGYIGQGQFKHSFQLYQEMQEDNVCPSTYTFVALLKSCIKLKDMQRGRQIHTEIKEKKFQANIFIGSSLIDMYGKCGSVLEAQDVFDKLPSQNVVSWTAMIGGHIEHGSAQEALQCFEQMKMANIPPNVVTFICSLKACGAIGFLHKGRELHTEITEQGLGKHHFVASSLIDMYFKCASHVEAQEVFDKLSDRDIVIWNALISGYAENGLSYEALIFHEQMELEGMSPNASTLVCVLKAYGNLGAINKVREIHVYITQGRTLQRDHMLGNTLIGIYCKCGSLTEAYEVFHKLALQDVVSWNTLIEGYAENEFGEEALRCFNEMQLECISSDVITFICVLKACGNIKAIENGRKIHVSVIQTGLESELAISNALIDMYAKCGSLREAEKVFMELPIRDLVSWTALMSGYIQHGFYHEALNCFDSMQREGIRPDDVALVCSLKACGGIGDIDKGQLLHAMAIEKGLESDIFVSSSLVDMYAKCGLLANAQAVFDKLSVRNVVSWTALIKGYAEHGLDIEAMECFEQMQVEGIFPNAVTFVWVLKACSSMTTIDKGQDIHNMIAYNGFEHDIFVASALIEMYAKCGLLIEATKVFNKLIVRDVLLWNVMIEGYSMNQDGKMAVQCFQEMQAQGTQADDVTFTCLLTACSHSGLVFEGQECFRVMKEDYGIVPTIEHYTCMIDLLARSGYLHEAEKLLESAPCLPPKETWIALLSACKIYGEIDLGQRCFWQLVHMKVQNASPYVLMANIYATAGRLDDAERVEALRNLRCPQG